MMASQGAGQGVQHRDDSPYFVANASAAGRSVSTIGRQHSEMNLSARAAKDGNTQGAYLRPKHKLYQSD